MTKQTLPKYNVVDLFAGAGGLSYGFLQTNRFNIKAAFEMNSNAQKTYKYNHGSDVLLYNDVNDALTETTKKELGNIDLIIGGPPCQGFSNANRQKNHVINQNNSLVKKYVQAILHLKPTAFLMENVSMLQSETHRFYVERNDQKTIEQYSIETAPAEIHILDEEFIFNEAIEIIKDKDRISNYLWREQDYLVLNIIYKQRNNIDKLEKALVRHKKQLLNLANVLLEHQEISDYIIRMNNVAGDAIITYFTKPYKSDNAKKLCREIEASIMLQRMLSKAQEVHDNDIKVLEYTNTKGLVVHVSSMSVIEYIEKILSANDNGYTITKGILSAASFGVPQKRMRFVLMGIKKHITNELSLPYGLYSKEKYRTVRDAIEDIESIDTTIEAKEGEAGIILPKYQKKMSDLGRQLRDSNKLYNHISTKTTEIAKKRFMAIKPGGNFHSLNPKLKDTYSNVNRTQNTIYLRLQYDEPSGTVVNVRKSMWIHPILHRALSVREAARLQTFPDSFVFFGTKDSQYQQVGNAVPPMLARAIAEHLCNYLDNDKNKCTVISAIGLNIKQIASST